MPGSLAEGKRKITRDSKSIAKHTDGGKGGNLRVTGRVGRMVASEKKKDRVDKRGVLES